MIKEEVRILLALCSPSPELERVLKAHYTDDKTDGIVVNSKSYMETTKAVADGCFNALITQQMAVGANGYTIEDLVTLRDINESTRIIIVVNAEMRGSDFLRRCLVENITCAVFASDASASTLIELIDKGRTRKDAKAYYGITEEKSGNDVVDAAVIKRLYDYLFYSSEGEFKERLDYIAQKATSAELTALFAKLDEEEKELVKEIPEYAPYFLIEGVRVTTKIKAAGEDSSQPKEGVVSALKNIAQGLVGVERELMAKRTAEPTVITKVETITETIVEKHFIEIYSRK